MTGRARRVRARPRGATQGTHKARADSGTHVVDNRAAVRLEHVGRHRRAHVAESDEANLAAARAGGGPSPGSKDGARGAATERTEQDHRKFATKSNEAQLEDFLFFNFPTNTEQEIRGGNSCQRVEVTGRVVVCAGAGEGRRKRAGARMA